MSQIDQGARWLYLPEEASGGRLLMGRDLPPRVVDAKVKGGFSVSGGIARRFTFVVEKYDGVSDHVIEQGCCSRN